MIYLPYNWTWKWLPRLTTYWRCELWRILSYVFSPRWFWVMLHLSKGIHLQYVKQFLLSPNYGLFWILNVVSFKEVSDFVTCKRWCKVIRFQSDHDQLNQLRDIILVFILLVYSDAYTRYPRSSNNTSISFTPIVQWFTPVDNTLSAWQVKFSTILFRALTKSYIWVHQRSDII